MSGGSWHVRLLTETEPGRRNRRTIDSALLLLAAIVIGLSAVISSSAEAQDRNVAQALTTVLGWAGALWRAAFLGVLGLAVVLVVDVLLRRRWDLVRDVLVAISGVVAAAFLLSGFVESNWLPLKAHLLARWGYPELRLAIAIAVLVVISPELVRSVRVLAGCLIPLAALGVVVLGAARPSDSLAGLALGLAAGALVRLLFGTAAGVPPTEQVRASLAALAVEVRDLRPASDQHVGSAEYVGHDAEGGPLKVRVLGRDAQDTQRLARQWRQLSYKDPPRSAPTGRLEQVEHQALATLMAAQAGVRVPEIVTAALGSDGDAVVVTREPDIEPLESLGVDQVSDETLNDLVQQVVRLQTAGISHGRLNASNVLVVGEGPMLVDLSAATLGAPRSQLDMDIAELLVALSILVGPDRVLGLAVKAGWGDAVGRILPYLQPAALTPHLRDLARSHDIALKDLREAAAQATGQEVPELVPLRRLRLRDLVATALVAVGAYLLISKLAKIGFGTIADELRQAEVAWVLVGLITAQLAFIPGGVSFRGAVPAPLPLLPCAVLQSAIKFINLTVPSSAGRIGINVRFLQRMGASTPEAFAAGAVDDLSVKIVQIALVLLTLPFVHIAVKSSDLAGGVPSGRLILTVLIVFALIVFALLLVPAVRAKVLPSMRTALSSLREVVRDRRKRLELFGGQLGVEVLYALTLGAACLAYGVHLTFAQLVLANAAASAFSSLIPSPGGVGTAEASLTAALAALGVENSTAFSIALTHRLCTYYLPPIWGYFSMRWLEKKAYI
ncbi:MAG: lysylphosphatidylglycerol synthase domain-containing protein [Gaiellaceae bacterium]